MSTEIPQTGHSGRTIVVSFEDKSQMWVDNNNIRNKDEWVSVSLLYPFKFVDGQVFCLEAYFYWNPDKIDFPNFSCNSLVLDSEEIESRIKNQDNFPCFNCNTHQNFRSTAFKNMWVFRIPKEIGKDEFIDYIKKLSHVNFVKSQFLETNKDKKTQILQHMEFGDYFYSNYENIEPEIARTAKLVTADNFMLFTSQVETLKPFQTVFAVKTRKFNYYLPSLTKSEREPEFLDNHPLMYYDQSRNYSFNPGEKNLICGSWPTCFLAFALGFPSLKELITYMSPDKASSTPFEGNLDKWSSTTLFSKIESRSFVPLSDVSLSEFLSLISQNFHLFRNGGLEITSGAIRKKEIQNVKFEP